MKRLVTLFDFQKLGKPTLCALTPHYIFRLYTVVCVAESNGCIKQAPKGPIKVTSH